MSLDQEPAKDVMNRFMWVNEDTMRVISREGTEMIIDVKGDFKQVEYNMIPLFDKEEIKDPLRHFYKNRKPLTVS